MNASFTVEPWRHASEKAIFPRAPVHTEIMYGPYGMKLALMNAQTLVNAFVKLPGGSRAVYGSSGLSHYRHPDHLGNSRLATTTSRTKYYDVAYAPYGENYDGSGTMSLQFTDQNQDTASGGWPSNLYDFMLREYRTAHGRWTQPDPAGFGAVDPTNPQTWNRYAYVVNNPMAIVDLLGDDGCYDPNGTAVDVDPGVCGSLGWTWVQTNFTSTNGNGQTTPVQLGVTNTNTGLAYTSLNGTILSSNYLSELGIPGLPGNGPYPYPSPTSGNNSSGCPSNQNCGGQGGGGGGNYRQQGVPPNPQQVQAAMVQAVLVPFEVVVNYLGCVGETSALTAAGGAAAFSVYSGGAAAPEGAIKGAIAGAVSGAVRCAGF